ncbi:MAG: sensor histidine kinase [Lachnospiraceae bacterium]
MLSQNDYERLREIQKTDPETYEFIFHIVQTALDAVSQGCHDIRNYVALISSYEQLFSMEQPDAATSNYYKKIEYNTAKTLELLDRIAKYRYSFRKNKEVSATLNVNELVAEVVDESKEMLEEDHSSIFLCVSKEDKRPAILSNVEKKAVTDAVWEVLLNGIQACNDHIYEPGLCPCIDIAVKESDQRIDVVVQDNAGGFSESMLVYGFTPFKSEKKGYYGLGLAIAYESVRKFAGDITVENISGGARVTISLPKNINQN